MIKLHDISKSFGDKTLFENFNLHIAEGEKILLTAPSGSGKTTLIRMLMGFEKPDSGDIVIDGQTMSKTTLKEIRQKVAYVSQDSDLTSSNVAVQLDTVFSYKINRHIRNYRDRFIDLCPQYGLSEEILTKDVSQISGGERQRVALIIATILDRKFMILDEITSGLDSQLKTEIADRLTAMDKTILIISHDTVWKSYETIREVTL